MIRHQIWGTENFLETRRPGSKRSRLDTGGRLEPELFCIFFQTKGPFLPEFSSHVQMVDLKMIFQPIFHGFHWLPFSISPFFSRT